MKRCRLPFAVGAVAVVCASCSSNSQLYNWKGYEQAVYAYTQTPDEQNLEKLLTVYDGCSMRLAVSGWFHRRECVRITDICC